MTGNVYMRKVKFIDVTLYKSRFGLEHVNTTYEITHFEEDIEELEPYVEQFLQLQKEYVHNLNRYMYKLSQ